MLDDLFPEADATDAPFAEGEAAGRAAWHGERVISLGHTETIRSVVYSPDGKLALSGSDDKTMRLWDLAGGLCVRVFEGHTNSVRSVAFSADGRLALSGSFDQTVRLWNLDAGVCQRVFKVPLAAVWSVAFGHEGETFFTGSSDGVRVWEAAGRQKPRVFMGHSGRVVSVAPSRDGRLVSGSTDKTLRLWEVASGKCLRVLEGHLHGVSSAAFSPDGRKVLSGSADTTLRLWDAENGQCLRVFEGHLDAVTCVAFVGREGRLVVSGSADKQLRLWDTATGRCLRSLGNHSDAVFGVTVCENGKTALSASGDKSLRCWRLPSGDGEWVLRQHVFNVTAAAWSPYGELAVTASADKTLRIWNTTGLQCEHVLLGHLQGVLSVAVGPGGQRILSGSADGNLRLWTADSGSCLQVLWGHGESVGSVAVSADGKLGLSGSADKTVRLWNLDTGRCLRVFPGHSDRVISVAIRVDGTRFLSASTDKTLRLWDAATGDCLFELRGHFGAIEAATFSPGGQHFLTASADKTVALWDAESGRCLRVFEGHTSRVSSVAFAPDGHRAVSGSADNQLRIWDLGTGRCEHVFTGHADGVVSVAWSADGRRVFSAAANGVMRLWTVPPLPEPVRGAARGLLPGLHEAASSQVAYTNAKVLLVGDSGAGKTGLSQRLALGEWRPSDSTIGAWATQWKLPVEGGPEDGGAGDGGEGDEREIWLWDFGGQADQRLIHQLYMEDTAVAVLVFDGQKEDVFDSLGQWDRDLLRACRRPFFKLLAQGRVDAGGLRVSRAQLEAFAAQRGYGGPLETSAKQNLGCAELKDAILAGIAWERLPWRSTPRVFKRLKDEIVRLKDEGRVLLRLGELRGLLAQRLAGEAAVFTDEELKAVVGLLAGPGVVWELDFGGWVLLQPERINAYAQALLQTLREDPLERGCLPEERVLKGELTYHSSLERLPAEEERFVLLAMHQTLVERQLCLREPSDHGSLLIFPSYYQRERPQLEGHPAVLVSYRLAGFLDDIYATLVVRLHHTRSFEQDQLWRYAADFRTLTEKKLGVKMTRLAEGAGELDLYFDPSIPLEEKIIFTRYVHEHLLQKAAEAVRLRHYACGHCGTAVGGREVAMRRLQKWLDEGKPGSETPTIVCQECEQRVPLWDDLERCFASAEIRERVRLLQVKVTDWLDNESKERALVGEVISTVALAGQISRELTVSDHGIDMEIELKNDRGEATGKKLYLQLKSGDSYLRDRAGDGAEIFRIQKPRHAAYWRDQAFPVLLVIRESDGEIRWMEIRDLLRRDSAAGREVKQIVFEGESFDVKSVRRWRDRLLA